ncbi:MAG: FprA family A-type flavoprotein [Bacteroidales bacterium]|nr:FprA family A-type flavoprotein [Bacteroidales bacterium]
MKAREIEKGVYWVGAIDWDLRNFHGYLTQRGSTYNAYLIVDEKITLVDSVKSYLAEEMFQRISSIIDPSKIDYIVCNHVEMDHSGAIPMVVEKNPNVKVFASPKGVSGLKAHYKANWNFQEVKSGDEINLGSDKIQFLLTPMVHWPDNMIGYMPGKKILFSNDAFGQHLASSERFDDEYPLDIVMEEARKYYANIVLPYSSQVRKALEDAAKLDIKIIANSHGIIWRKHIPEIIKEYSDWSSNTVAKKALIVYDTMWGSTAKIADAIYDAFERKGYRIYKYNLQQNHISDIMTEVLSAEYICVGSPTLNKSLLPSVAAFLTYMQGLSPKNRKTIIFGSYGWAQQNIKDLEMYMNNCEFEIKHKINVNYIPDELQLEQIRKEVFEVL